MPPNPFSPIIDLLKTSLGEGPAEALVLREAAAAKLSTIASPADGLNLLRRIEALGGTAGLAAKLAIGRLQRGVPFSSLSSAGEPTRVSLAPTPAVKAQQSLAISDLIAQLSRAIGDEKAADAVYQAMGELRIPGPTLSETEVIRLLELLATRGGGVGTVARFAKVRFMLQR
jgi:hypothetical protein